MGSEVLWGRFHSCFIQKLNAIGGRNLAFGVLLILDSAPVHYFSPRLPTLHLSSTLNQGVTKAFKAHDMAVQYGL